MTKLSDVPSFAVGPQPISRPSTQLKHGQQITFKTDQHQYKHSGQKMPSKPNSASATAQLGTYSRKVRFADPKTQHKFTCRQHDPDEHPAKRPKVIKYGRDNAEPSFSVRKPVKVSVPMDAWQLIFQSCDLAFLMKARLVCRDFRDALDRQAIWRTARVNYYGSEIPDRPQDLTELQFAILLVGRGCQIQPCTRRDTRKVYWPFMLRMCDKCFGQLTEVPNFGCAEARLYSQMYQRLEYDGVRETIPAQLPGLLPAGRLKSGRWMGPRFLNPQQTNWLTRYTVEPTVVLTADYEALKLDFVDKVQDDPEYFLVWARLKWEEARERMKVATELEHINLVESSRPCDLREQKVTYFREKAAELDPPMTPSLLDKFAAYHNALDTSNAASLRSWDILRAKIDIPELRTQAEQLIRWEKDDAIWIVTSKDSLHDRLYKHRESGKFLSPKSYAKEQEAVIKIAELEIEKLLDVAHDEDVLLMLLRKVRQAYESLEEKPEGLNGDGSVGVYQLTLDDALMVVSEVLKPRVLGIGRDRFQKITTSLRCIACTRSNTATSYNFSELMTHIRRVHARHVAKDAHWYRFSYPVKARWRTSFNAQVAWYNIPWFKSIPALPYHRRPSPGMLWDPDIETEYVQHVETRAPSTAFERLSCTHNTKIPIDDFTSNFCRAVRTLIQSRLDSPSIIKVALEYANKRRNSRRSTGSTTSTLSVSQLVNLEGVCARIAPRLEFKFQCKTCVQEVATSRRRRRPPKAQMLSTLVLHWESKHEIDPTICITEQIVLPTESELMITMEREDDKLDATRSAHLKRNERNNEPIDPRTAALMDTPSIRSCFDKLFTQPSDQDEIN